MRKIRVGVITCSDGRDYIHEEMLETNWNYQKNIADILNTTGFIEVVEARKIVDKPKVAVEEGKFLLKNDVDITICNYSIWCYPHLTAIATKFAPGPYIMFCNLHP